MSAHRATAVAFAASARKAFASAAIAVVGVAVYLVSVLPADASPSDITFVQWLGSIVFVAAAFGITYQVPNKKPSSSS